MEFHPTDFEQYVKITGHPPTAEASEAYAKLVRVRHMFQTGPVGYDNLINMVFRLDIPFKAEPPKKTTMNSDWESLPADGSARVEVMMYGDWQPARYRGKIAGGTIAVEMENEPGHIVELTRTTSDLVRIVESDPFEQAQDPTLGDITPLARTFVEEEAGDYSAEDDLDDDEPGEPETIDIDSHINWADINKGEAVYIEQEDGAIVTGSYVGMTTVKVSTDGSDDAIEVTKIMVTPEGDSGPAEYYEDQITIADISAIR